MIWRGAPWLWRRSSCNIILAGFVIKRLINRLCCLAAISAAILVGNAKAQQANQDFDDPLPLWEVGVVGAGGRLPDYPAADESHVQGLALPYVIYRGDVFRVGDRGAARGIVAKDQRFEIDLGIDAAFPVDSDSNDARDGMDNLDFLLELGPRITYSFLPNNPRNELDLSIAGRAVISTDGVNWRYQGLVVNPALVYRRNLFDRRMRGILSWGGLFGFDGINRYFYRVAPSEAQPGRAQFNPDDGYLGSEFSAGMSFNVTDRIRLFGGVQLGYWAGAENADSPLHRTDVSYTVGGGVRWSIWQSDRMATK